MQIENQKIKVYSHVRSGTHLLEAFLAKNFYRKERLSIRPIKWGHWSNRKTRILGNKFGELFGSHLFPDQVKSKLDEGPNIYIYRDGRPVAASVWRTPNFLNKSWYPIKFSEFIHKKLDWYGSPGNMQETNLDIVEHWFLHTSEWEKVEHPNVLLVQYELLVRNPEIIAKQIHDKFGLPLPEEVKPIDKPTGLLPSTSSKFGWKNIWSREDLEYYDKLVPKDYFARYNN